TITDLRPPGRTLRLFHETPADDRCGSEAEILTSPPRLLWLWKLTPADQVQTSATGQERPSGIFDHPAARCWSCVGTSSRSWQRISRCPIVLVSPGGAVRISGLTPRRSRRAGSLPHACTNFRKPLAKNP